MRCKVVVEALQTKLNQLKTETKTKSFASSFRAFFRAAQVPDVQKIQEIKNLEELIGKLSPDTGFVGGSYEGANPSTICDLMSLDPVKRVGVILDGTGHNDPTVVTDQFPIFQKMIEKYTAAAENCNSPEELNDWMKTVGMREFSTMFTPLHEQYQEEGARLQPVFEEVQQGFITYMDDHISEDTTLEEKQDATRKLMPKEKFDLFLEALNNEKLHAAIAMTELYNKENPNDDDKQLIELLKAVQNKDYDQFIQLFANVSSKNVINNLMKSLHRRPFDFYFHMNQPASFFGKIMKNSEGREFLCAAQQQDCCYLVLRSDGTLKTRPLAGDKYAIEALDPGDVVFAFSDGIGEFLSLDDVVKIVNDNHLLGAAAIEHAIREKLEEYSKKDMADKVNPDRKQAIRERGGARNWDKSSADPGCVDDMAFLVMYAEPDPEALLKENSVPNDEKAANDSVTSTGGFSAASSSTDTSPTGPPLPTRPVFSSAPPPPSGSLAASSSTDVSPASSLISSGVLKPADRYEGHRVDLDRLEKRWAGLHKAAEDEKPYDPNNEPMFYAMLGRDNQFLIECMTRERFAVDAKTTVQEATDLQATPNGVIVAQGRAGERIYYVGPQLIAERLLAEELTTQDKIRCLPIVNALKTRVLELKSQGASSGEIQHLEGLIQQLSPDIEFSSAPPIGSLTVSSSAETSSSRSPAASSSTNVSPASSLISNGVLKPANRHEGHRLDLDILEKRWVGLHKAAEDKKPYDPNNEPMFYAMLGTDNQFLIECMTRERFAEDAKTTVQEATDLHATPNGVIVAQGRTGERIYYVGSQLIAEHLVAEELTTQDKIRCWPIVNALKTRVLELKSQGASLDEIQHLEGLIKQLSPDIGFTGGHYARAEVGVNVCDFVHVDPLEGVAVLIDGVGHGDLALVRDQFPIYRNIVRLFTAKAKEYDSPEAFTAWMNSEGEALLQREFDGLRKEYSQFKSTHGHRFTHIVNEILGELYLSAERGVQEDAESIKKEFSKEDFDLLRNGMGEGNIQNAIQMMESERRPDPDNPFVINVMKALQENNYDKCIEYLTQASPSAIRLLQQSCSLKRTTIGGNAAVFAKIMETKDGREFLYTGQWSDCCYFVKKSDGSIKQWNSQNTSRSGLGDHFEPGKHELLPLDPGDVIFAFSDGIGEFLSRDELTTIVNDNYLSGATAIERAIRKELKKHVKTENDPYSKDRDMASAPLESRARAKIWDDTGNDPHNHDDMGFFILCAKSESEAAASKVKVKEEPKAPQESWWNRIRGR